MKGKNIILAIMSWALLVTYCYCVVQLNDISKNYAAAHPPQKPQTGSPTSTPAPAPPPASTPPNTTWPENTPWPELLQVLKSAGGLVSALVISLLAITKPGKGIGSSLVDDDAGSKEELIVTTTCTLYVLAWLYIGGFCLMKGSLTAPLDSTNVALKEISSLGITWFGLFLGALYGYFGVQRTDSKT